MLKDFPIENGVVMGHLAPDADSLCAGIVFTRLLRDSGKEAFFYVPENFSPQYQWLIDENLEFITFDKESSFCRKASTFYILDCEPTKARTGFAFPSNAKIINIDHHIHRLKEVEPKKDIKYGDNFYGEYTNYGHTMTVYLENCVSTSSILNKRFGRKDDILALGIYFDSVALSMKIIDATQTISKLDIDDERLSYMINSSRYQGNKRQWDALVKVNTWWSADQDMCFCYDTSPLLDGQQMMYVLGKYAKTVVFFHKNKNVSLRTINANIDLSDISSKYGGGGHKGAAGFRIIQKVSLIKLAESIKAQSSGRSLSEEEKVSLLQFERNLNGLFKQSDKERNKL